MKRNTILIGMICILLLSIPFGLIACGDESIDLSLSFIVDDNTYSTIKTNGGEVISFPNNPTKEGYIFEGWFWDKDVWQKPFTANSLLDTSLTADMKVYAYFTVDHQHQYSTEFHYDSDNHWYECSCGKKESFEAHTFSEWNIVKFADKDNKGLCTRNCLFCSFQESRKTTEKEQLEYATKEINYVELNGNEEVLGRGIDVISAKSIIDIKTSSSIFDSNKIKDLRFSKWDYASSKFVATEEESLTSFIQNWNANLNVNVSWGFLFFYGGSVDIKAMYEGGQSSSKYNYYQALTSNVTEYFLFMQGDYKSALDKNFKKALYSETVSPSELFEKYGTHFIASGTMGGKLTCFMQYSGNEGASYHDIAASVKANVFKLFGNNTDVDGWGGYSQEWNEKVSGSYKNMVITGGDNTISFSDLNDLNKYSEWAKSVKENPVLMGVYNSSSLVAIWDLIDPEVDSENKYEYVDINGNIHYGTRRDQIKNAFTIYGKGKYNELLASLPEKYSKVDSIASITIFNNEKENTVKDNVYEVYRGLNNIIINVVPSNATGYEEKIIIENADESISVEGLCIKIANGPINNKSYDARIYAGEEYKDIKIKVKLKYTVDFTTDSPTKQLDSLHDVLYGTTISKPDIDNSREGMHVEGWYLDAEFKTKYDFNQAVTEDLSLYAKWVGDSNCLARGTMITLANGETVPVEELNGDEQLLIWNMFTGTFDSSPMLFIDYDEPNVLDRMDLYFSDNTELSFIGVHGLWDVTLNEYVYLTGDNAVDYIGHTFKKQVCDEYGNMKLNSVQLVDVIVTQELTDCFCPTLPTPYCYFTNGILSIPDNPEFHGFLNIFAIDSETMRIDEELYEEDIRQYGLFTYEEFNSIVELPEVIFGVFDGKYLKVSLAKGLITIDQIKCLLDRYMKFFIED